MQTPPIDFSVLLRDLATARPVFHSEADFQHALAWAIHVSSDAAQVLLEVPTVTRLGRMSIDVVVGLGGSRLALELKYKTRPIKLPDSAEPFLLADDRAHPLGRYDVLKDVQRVEAAVEAGRATCGAVIFITNDSAYWTPPRSSTDTSAAFSLDEGRTITGQLRWSAKTGGTKKRREEPIVLQNSYRARWAHYSTVGSGSYTTFRSLVLAVPPLAGDQADSA